MPGDPKNNWAAQTNNISGWISIYTCDHKEMFVEDLNK